MWTIEDLLTQARDLLQDTVTPYRFSDARLLRTLNNAFGEGYRKRPDLYVGVSLVIPFVSSADLADPFPLDDQFFPAFVEYVVGFTEMSDDEFTVDGRAQALLNLFFGKLGQAQ